MVGATGAEGSWNLCDLESLHMFSAFGRMWHKALSVSAVVARRRVRSPALTRLPGLSIMHLPYSAPVTRP